jgi:4-hydroxy-4-methyl-2-oxoglutarate aldolase
MLARLFWNCPFAKVKRRSFSPMKQLAPAQLEELRQLDSCAVANAIEAFDVRLRNTGFTDSRIRCVFEDFPPMVGYAATVRVRTSEPPMEGHSYYYRLDWLDHVLSIPPPRILVLEDLDRYPGLGSLIGDVHTNVLAALNCIGVVTNGAVRDLPAARAINFQMFAHNSSVSHAFAHIFDFGKAIEVGHMEVHPGDLIHGDRHGVQTIPFEIAPKIPGVAREMATQEEEIIRSCQSAGFSLDVLRAEIKALGEKRKEFKR